MKSAIYVGVIEPSDRYREELAKRLEVGVLTLSRIDPCIDSFLATLSKVLKEESPEYVVLDEEMPVNIMMETFSMEAPKLMGNLLGKSVEIYGLDAGESLADIVSMNSDEFEDHLKQKVKTSIIVGRLEY